jgi:hypothetical protein
VSPDEDVGTVPNLVDIVGSPNGEVLSVLIDKRGQFSPTKPDSATKRAAAALAWSAGGLGDRDVHVFVSGTWRSDKAAE